MSKQVRSNIPALILLSQAKTALRKTIISQADSDLISALSECILNTIKGRVKLKKHQIRKLRKNKIILQKLADQKTSISSRRKLLIQNGGGFLPALLIPALSVLFSLLK